MWKQLIWMSLHQSVRNWLINSLKKMAVLGKYKEILNSKSEECTEADEDIFVKMVAVTLKWINPYQQIIARKKMNDILFEIKLSDWKQQQSHSTNEHFWGPINTSNNITWYDLIYWYHWIFTPYRKLLMVNHLYQLAHVIKNRQHFQN